MELLPKKGIGTLRFGMSRKQVETELGAPDRKFEDEDFNEVWVYNELMLQLSFYEDEDFRFGYLATSHPEASFQGKTLMGSPAGSITPNLEGKSFRNWESIWDAAQQTHFNEENWLILIEEYGRIVRVELGATLVNDKFVWAL